MELVFEIVIVGVCDNSYVVEWVWCVEDECGNSILGIQMIIVVDIFVFVIDLQGDFIFFVFGIEICLDNVISLFEVLFDCGDEFEVFIFFDFF